MLADGASCVLLVLSESKGSSAGCLADGIADVVRMRSDFWETKALL